MRNETRALLSDVIFDAPRSYLEVFQAQGSYPRPLVMAVAFAASTSFLTPVGYQTNTLVYNAGHYRFTDFLRTGAPVTVLVLVTAVVMIPIVWPG